MSSGEEDQRRASAEAEGSEKGPYDGLQKAAQSTCILLDFLSGPTAVVHVKIAVLKRSLGADEKTVKAGSPALARMGTLSYTSVARLSARDPDSWGSPEENRAESEPSPSEQRRRCREPLSRSRSTWHCAPGQIAIVLLPPKTFPPLYSSSTERRRPGTASKSPGSSCKLSCRLK